MLIFPSWKLQVLLLPFLSVEYSDERKSPPSKSRKGPLPKEMWFEDRPLHGWKISLWSTFWSPKQKLSMVFPWSYRIWGICGFNLVVQAREPNKGGKWDGGERNILRNAIQSVHVLVPLWLRFCVCEAFRQTKLGMSMLQAEAEARPRRASRSSWDERRVWA